MTERERGGVLFGGRPDGDRAGRRRRLGGEEEGLEAVACHEGE